PAPRRRLARRSWRRFLHSRLHAHVRQARIRVVPRLRERTRLFAAARLFDVGVEQNSLLSRQIPLADARRAGWQPVEEALARGQGCRRFLGWGRNPGAQRTFGGIPNWLQQILLMVDEVLGIHLGKLVDALQCDGPCRTCLLAVAAEDAAQQIYVEDPRVALAR